MRIYIGGTFDLLHPGHIELFENARAYGTVIVSLNTDSFCERYKRKPVMNLAERARMISSLKCVDEIVINIGDEDSKPAILDAKATHILHGNDWHGEGLMKQMGLTEEWLQEHNIKMVYLPYTEGISTSDIILRCQKYRLSA